MKTVLMIVAVVMSLALAAPLMAQSAADYSRMSTDELYQLKQQPDHQYDTNLDSVWVQRVANMTPEELTQYNVQYSLQEVQKMQQQRMSPGVPGN
jgi:hypothetical protein